MFYGNHCQPQCQPPCVAPPVVHPTKCCVKNTYSSVVVPHIHPVHTTVVNHETVQNQHYFPQSSSYGNTVQNVNVAGTQYPMGGGFGQGAGYGHGMGMGAGYGHGGGYGGHQGAGCCPPKPCGW